MARAFATTSVCYNNKLFAYCCSCFAFEVKAINMRCPTLPYVYCVHTWSTRQNHSSIGQHAAETPTALYITGGAVRGYGYHIRYQ